MRYNDTHKQETRAHILRTAARLFRRNGYDGVSIDDLMEAAGLTRGGFYNHFASKAELFACALETDHDFITRLKNRSERAEGSANAQAIGVASDYLAPDNREPVIAGCSMAALAMDTARGGELAQQAFAGALRELASEFARGLTSLKDSQEDSQEDSTVDQRALQASIASIGGLLLASATAADADLCRQVSAAATALVAQVLSEPS